MQVRLSKSMAQTGINRSPQPAAGKYNDHDYIKRFILSMAESIFASVVHG